MQKDREREILCLFAVGANCVRPRAFTERPYEDDFLSAGKTCFVENTPSRVYCTEVVFRCHYDSDQGLRALGWAKTF